MANKLTIEIPRANEKEVVTIPSGELGLIKKRFEKIDQILFGVMLVIVLSLVSIVVATVGLFLDQMRYNNVAYKEYSEKVQTLQSMKNINNELLNQNMQNQEHILEQQKQIIELLKKK